jgi:hypothetical protein
MNLGDEHICLLTKKREDASELVRRLNKQFLEEYDYTFWARRVAELQLILSQNGLVTRTREYAAQLLGNPDLRLSDESIRNSIMLDIHFSAYHSTEALFGITFAFVLEPDLPWYWLTTYKFYEFNKMVSDLAERGLSVFNPDEILVAKALFFNIADKQLQPAVESSARFATRYIRALAKEFCDKEDYNSFKHGLRTLRARSTSGGFSTVEGRRLLEWNETVTTFLEVGEPVNTGEGVLREVKVAAKAIDHERSIRIIVNNTHLTHNLIQIKKAQLENKKTANLKIFDEDSNVLDVLKPTKSGFSLKKMTFPFLVSYMPKHPDSDGQRTT